jgi:hypothetical protein
LIREVQKKGLLVYSLSQGNLYEKEWITINSHYMAHTELNIQRFGIPRNTAVFAFESNLGYHKRWNSHHKNGISEGKAMMTQAWAEIMTDLILEIHSPTLKKEKSPMSSIKFVARVGENFFLAEKDNGNHYNAYEVADVVFDEDLYYLKFNDSDICTEVLKLMEPDIDEFLNFVVIRNVYFLYNCH